MSEQTTVGSTDLTRGVDDGATVRIGGRVVQIEGASVQVADALGVVEIVLASPAPGLTEGSLVVNSSQGGGVKDTWVLAD